MAPDDSAVVEQQPEGRPPADAKEISRRQFLAFLSAGLGGVGAVLVAIPFASFLLAPLLKKTPQVWRVVGDVDTYKVGETVQVGFPDPSPLSYAGVSAQTAAWLRRVDKDKFQAFAVNCTHLGCPVQWIPDGKIFLCPCHGGVYNQDGVNVAGPPPHPLPEYQVRTTAGQVEILTARVPIA